MNWEKAISQAARVGQEHISTYQYQLFPEETEADYICIKIRHGFISRTLAGPSGYGAKAIATAEYKPHRWGGSSHYRSIKRCQKEKEKERWGGDNIYHQWG